MGLGKRAWEVGNAEFEKTKKGREKVRQGGGSGLRLRYDARPRTRTAHPCRTCRLAAVRYFGILRRIGNIREAGSDISSMHSRREARVQPAIPFEERPGVPLHRPKVKMRLTGARRILDVQTCQRIAGAANLLPNGTLSLVTSPLNTGAVLSELGSPRYPCRHAELVCNCLAHLHALGMWISLSLWGIRPMDPGCLSIACSPFRRQT